MSDVGKLRGWLFECKNCGRPITSYYDMWKHDHKLDDPFAWACSDDAGERYGGPQAEPTDLGSDAIVIRRDGEGNWPGDAALSLTVAVEELLSNFPSIGNLVLGEEFGVLILAALAASSKDGE